MASTLTNPFFALAKSVGVEGAFQRVESVVTALWTFADLTMGGVLIFALRNMGEKLLPAKWSRWMPWVVVVMGVALAVLVFPVAGVAEEWDRRIVPGGNLILGLALPAILLLGKKIGQSCRGRGISCAGETESEEDIG